MYATWYPNLNVSSNKDVYLLFSNSLLEINQTKLNIWWKIKKEQLWFWHSKWNFHFTEKQETVSLSHRLECVLFCCHLFYYFNLNLMQCRCKIKLTLLLVLTIKLNTNTQCYWLIQLRSISAFQAEIVTWPKLYPTSATESPQRLMKLIGSSINCHRPNLQ